MITLADRWKKLPEEIEAMDASAMRLLYIVNTGTPQSEQGSQGMDEDMSGFAEGGEIDDW